jgi:hypothetical protein
MSVIEVIKAIPTLGAIFLAAVATSRPVGPSLRSMLRSRTSGADFRNRGKAAFALETAPTTRNPAEVRRLDNKVRVRLSFSTIKTEISNFFAGTLSSISSNYISRKSALIGKLS